MAVVPDDGPGGVAVLTVNAPAKVNLVLEVLGRRDGYHDICSIAQTIDVSDTLTFEPADDVAFSCTEPELLENNLIPRAVRLLRDRCGVSAGAHIHLEKQIPWAAGLGGGSSDAAATLLGLNGMWGLELHQDQLIELSALLGSDVPLFILGGTVRLEGRGERVHQMPDHPQMHAVLLSPHTSPPDGKTGLLYRQLRPDMFTTGQFVRAAGFALQRNGRVPEDLLFNVFEKIAEDVFPEIERDREVLQEATGARTHLAGSGPTLYAMLDSETAADEAAARLRRSGRTAFTARTTGPVSTA